MYIHGILFESNRVWPSLNKRSDASRFSEEVDMVVDSLTPNDNL